MSSLASINIRFSANLSQFSTEMANALREVDKFGQKMQAVGRSLSGFITLPVLGAAAAAIKFGSDFEESSNKVDVAFGSSAQSVKDFSKTTLDSFGIAAGSALEMASLFGDMGTSMGIARGESATMSKSLVGLAGDLASFKNIGIDQAQTALVGIFSGETESLKRLGVVMTEAALQEYAYAQGIRTKVSDMGQAEKVQLRYNFVLSKTTNAQGDFERTGGGAANQMRIFQEVLKEIATSLGQVILPAFTKIVTKVNEWLKSFNSLSEGAKTTIVVIAGIAAAIGPLLLVIGAVASAIPAITAGFASMGIVSAATLLPVLAIGAGLAAIAYVVVNNWVPIKKTLVDIANYFVDLYNNSTIFRGAIEYIAVAFKNMWAVAKLNFNNILATVVFVGNNIFNFFKTLGGLIKSVLTFDLDGIKTALSSGFSTVGKDAVAFFRKLSDNTKATANEIGSNISTALNNTFKGNNIKKIVIPKDKVDATAVSDAVEEAAVTPGGGKPGKVEKLKAPANLSALQNVFSVEDSTGTASAYDAEISKLKTFRDEIATTAEQIKAANDAIAAVEFGKALKFDPESIIKTSMTTVAIFEDLGSRVRGFRSSLSQEQDLMVANAVTFNEQFSEVWLNTIAGFAENFGALVGSFAEGGASLANVGSLFLTTLADMAIQVGKIAITTGVAIQAIKKALESLNPVVAIAAGVALIAVGTFAKSALGKAGSGKPQAFANGGIVGGNSMYGDKILARVNSGELILNQNQQRNLYGQMGGGSSDTIIPNIKIQGSDLIVVFDRASKKKNRLG